MRALSPVTLTSAPITIKFTQGDVGGTFKMANESAYALRLSSPSGGFDDWLLAGMVDVFPIVSIDLVISPQVLTTTASSPSSKAVVTVMEPGKVFLGTFPTSVTREVGANQLILTAAFNLTVNGNGAFFTIVPAVAGQSVYTLGLTLDLAEAFVTAKSFIQISDDHSVFPLLCGKNLTQQWIDNMTEPLQCTLGDGLSASNYDTVVHNFLVNVDYRQY